MSINPILIRDRQDWETMTPAPISMQAGGFVVASQLKNFQYALYFRANNSLCIYNPYNDGYYFPVFGLGAASNTTGGSAACWVYDLPVHIVQSYPGFEILSNTEFLLYAGLAIPQMTSDQITESLVGINATFGLGPNKGVRRKIIAAENIGNNLQWKITIERPFPDPDLETWKGSGTIMTGFFVVFTNNGSVASNNLAVLHPNLQFQTRYVNGLNLPAGMTTNCSLTATPSINGPIFTGSVASATSNTITVSPSLGVSDNTYRDYQIRIVSGSGEGQRLTVTSHTTTTFTLSGSWDVIPSGSKYGVEPNDDYLYLTTSTANTVYRYKFSTQTWTSSSAIFLNSMNAASAQLVWADSADFRTYTTSTGSGYESINAASLYAFVAGGFQDVGIVDVDLSSYNTTSGYTEARNVGTSVTSDLNDGAIYYELANSGRVFQYNREFVDLNIALPTDTYGQSTATIGNRLFVIYSKDRKGNYVKYLYHVHSSTNVVRRLRLS